MVFFSAWFGLTWHFPAFSVNVMCIGFSYQNPNPSLVMAATTLASCVNGVYFIFILFFFLFLFFFFLLIFFSFSSILLLLGYTMLRAMNITGLKPGLFLSTATLRLSCRIYDYYNYWQYR